MWLDGPLNVKIDYPLLPVNVVCTAIGGHDRGVGRRSRGPGAIRCKHVRAVRRKVREIG